jgi:hypothetical protein|tara:strand:+ start:125 stop:331 length:207 start_codon:yes stop_codon:yes gene_type:complete
MAKLLSKILLCEKEVERMYGLNFRTLQRERNEGKGIPYHKIGRRVLYRVSDIEAFLASCKHGELTRYD